jgi:hypothetical protein
VKILSFAELIAPDERTLRFTGLGFSTFGTLTPEASARFQQECVAGADLEPSIPESVRDGFDRIRLFHSYGVLCYELFTATDDLTWVVLEHALRQRFLTFYDGNVPIIDKAAKADTFETTDFDTLASAFRRGGSHADRWLLLAPRVKIEMPLTLDPLLRWAHQAGVLNGQVNRRVQLAVFGDLRNHFAHGGSVARLGMPVDSTRSINDLAELTNRLWGFTTPNGRLYPSAIPRHPLVLSWNDAWPTQPGAEFRTIYTSEIAHAPSQGWSYIVVLAPDIDQRGLEAFDARYDTTPYPLKYLWGPGARDQAISWLAENQPVGDEVSPLDRLFLIRRKGGKVYLPVRPENFLGLPSQHRRGTWKLVMADFPNDAHYHVRHQNQGHKECPDEHGCAVTLLGSGSWGSIETQLRKMRPNLVPVPYVNAGVPRNQYPADVGY